MAPQKKMENPIIDKKTLERIIQNRAERIELARKNHFWFFNIYFNHYIKYPFANFHHEMFNITEDDSTKEALIIAFRGSAKSTIFTLSYPIWSIVGRPQKKFVIILGQTQRQARQQLANIKREYEGNGLFGADMGPFREVEDEWGASSLVISNYNARITAASMEQTIRGMRHGEYRPDLVIIDDIEDLQTVKTKEGRDKIEQWITGEVIPAGDKDTKIIYVGNLLHEDSLLMRTKGKIEAGLKQGKIIYIPLIDDNNKITWQGKYTNMEEIELERKKIGNEASWQREYLLKIIPDSERVIQPDWIKYHEGLPQQGLRYVITAIDPAFKQNQSSDYTAMVTGHVYGYGKDMKIYIDPVVINKKLAPHEMYECARIRSRALGNGIPTKLIIEDVGAQYIIIDQLTKESIPVSPFQVKGQDKYERLSLAAPLIQNGGVLFSKTGNTDLIKQLLGFGVEKHEDMVDSLVMVILYALEKNIGGLPFVHWVDRRSIFGQAPRYNSLINYDDDDWDYGGGSGGSDLRDILGKSSYLK